MTLVSWILNLFFRTTPEEAETYSTVAEDNSSSLLHFFGQFPSVEDFLSSEDVHISVHPTQVEMEQQEAFLNYTFDIDGIVAEVHGFSAITIPLNYLTFEKPSARSLKPVFHLLKKHIAPGHFSQKQFKFFKACKGILLANSQVHSGCIYVYIYSKGFAQEKKKN